MQLRKGLALVAHLSAKMEEIHCTVRKRIKLVKEQFNDLRLLITVQTITSISCERIPVKCLPYA